MKERMSEHLRRHIVKGVEKQVKEDCKLVDLYINYPYTVGLKDYIRYLADSRLIALGLFPLYDMPKELSNFKSDRASSIRDNNYLFFINSSELIRKEGMSGHLESYIIEVYEKQVKEDCKLIDSYINYPYIDRLKDYINYVANNRLEALEIFPMSDIYEDPLRFISDRTNTIKDDSYLHSFNADGRYNFG